MAMEGYKLGKSELVKIREEAGNDIGKIMNRITERITSKEEEVRIKKIQGSKYNIEYERVRTDRRPEYLKTKRKKRDMRLIARFRCGNELSGRQYWREEGEKTCRICGEGEEDIKHVLRECNMTKEDIREEEFLDERGIGLPIMHKIVNERARKEKQGRSAIAARTGTKDKKPKTLQRRRF